MREIPALYEVAKQVCHELGLPWTDPRTGQTFPPPPHYRCKACGAVSFNRNDIKERYCGRCHQFADDRPTARKRRR